MSNDAILDRLRKHGGPAFPPNAGWRDNSPDGQGMTLRDYYAAQALVGIGLFAMPEHGSCDSDAAVTWRANLAHRQADAMLAARNKERPQ